MRIPFWERFTPPPTLLRYACSRVPPLGVMYQTQEAIRSASIEVQDE